MVREVLYDAKTAEAMANRVAEAYLRGSVGLQVLNLHFAGHVTVVLQLRSMLGITSGMLPGSCGCCMLQSCISCMLNPTFAWWRSVTVACLDFKVVLLADVGRPNRDGLRFPKVLHERALCA